MTETTGVLTRLSTFGITTWLMKPKEISPVECAKYGFINTGEDLICCVECKNELRVTPDKEVCNFQIGWNELYLTHRPSCSYRTPQKLNYAEINEFTAEAFQAREEKISSAFSIYPIIDHKSFNGLSQEELKQLFRHYPKFHAARALALFGWDAESPSLLRCKICNISVSISQLEYELIQNEYQNFENIERRSLYQQSERKLRSGHVIKLAKHLHLRRAHRYYCPWINDITSNDFSYYTNRSEAVKSGWRLLSHTLLERFYSYDLIINTARATIAEHISKVPIMNETHDFLQRVKDQLSSSLFPEDEGRLDEELDLPLPNSLNS